MCSLKSWSTKYLEALELVLKLLGRCGATRITNECHRACAVVRAYSVTPIYDICK